MLTRYVQAALDRAHHEIIEDQEPFYGEVVGLDGVWATGQTLESCRRDLAEAIEDWLLFSLVRGMPIPPLSSLDVQQPAPSAFRRGSR